MGKLLGTLIAVGSLLTVLSGCGGDLSNPSIQTWRIETSSLPYEATYLGAALSTPGRALRIRDVTNPSVLTINRVLEEVDYVSGHVVRSTFVFDGATKVAVSADGSQAYVYQLGGLSAGEGLIQRVSLSTFTVSAAYSAPVTPTTFISDLEVNPWNPMEIAVVVNGTSSGNRIGPLCFRNDAMLASYPGTNSTGALELCYVNRNTIWGSDGNSVGAEQTTYTVGNSGVFKVGSTTSNALYPNRFSSVGSVLFGDSGLILSYPSLSIVRNLAQTSVPYNTSSLSASTSSNPAWFVGFLQSQKMDVLALTPGSWEPAPTASIPIASSELFYQVLPLPDSSAIIQTSSRTLLVRLVEERAE